jgi:peptidoglycan/xylan/chitin deacetylase (PgdA/CDA1 family)
MTSFRLVVFCGEPHEEIARLLRRVQQELPNVSIAGVVFQKPAGRTRRSRWSGRLLIALRDAAIRFLHACPSSVSRRSRVTLEDVARSVRKRGGQLFMTPDLRSPEAAQFVQGLNADLGVALGTIPPDLALYTIPRLGSIQAETVDKLEGLRQVPVEWNELRVAVGSIGVERDAALFRTAVIPIDPYDDVRSLGLKSKVVCRDLICATVADLMTGIQSSPAGTRIAEQTKDVRPRTARYSVQRTRPVWKLLVRSILLSPFALFRNWYYRSTKAFPVVIFYHHVITDRPHHLGTPTSQFARQIAFLKRFYRIASLEQATQMLKDGRVTEPTAVLTFDDGYADNYVNLRAITEEYDVPAFFFVSTGHMTNGKAFDHDLRRNQLGFPPLSWDQVLALHRAGFEFGCHTRNHFDCGSTDVELLREEIEGSRQELGSRAAIWSDHFSFPWGMPKNMSDEGQRVARSLFKYVYAAAGGVNMVGMDPEQTLVRRVDHPSSVWEAELALQCALNFETWGDFFPRVPSKTSR